MKISWLLGFALWWPTIAVVSAATTTDGDGDSVTETTDEADDSTVFRHFIAHNQTMTCSADEHARPFNNQVRGVNLGGWMVSCCFSVAPRVECRTSSTQTSHSLSSNQS